ncbi:MAG: two-component sensor histidine kinase [Rhodospirillales bacterium]|nr:two-component sensor histidine kinase [Rhodospirillales bacterium]
MVMKNFLPRSLLGRTLLIIVMPLVVLQVVSAFIFFESHWETVSRRLARDLAGDIAVLVSTFQEHPEVKPRMWMLDQAARHMGINVTLRTGEVLANENDQDRVSNEGSLAVALAEQVHKPFRIDAESVDRHVVVEIQLVEGVLSLVTTRKRLFSTTTYAFVLWMVGTSMIVFGVATLFMRNQVKPVLRLARAADDFGKGRDVPRFKPEGAKEVRQAALAFISMRQRIIRQIGQRTAMLAGVSHDLRTPLTRMKLQLEMMGRDDDVGALKEDLAEMERMLEGYLAFARGEGSEKQQIYDLALVLEQVARSAQRNGTSVDLQIDGDLTVQVRRMALHRALTNLVENAARYGDRVWISAERKINGIEVIIDDDGPGVPEEKREDVFKPFVRLEASRNPGTGGVGLGLAIARDVVRSHGGEIVLSESPQSGLRARLRLPL